MIDNAGDDRYSVYTAYLQYEWDPVKDERNRIKHGVSFEEAATAFEDPNALLIADFYHSLEEERFILLGVSSKDRVLYVCHCYREPQDRIRIISARKATEKEVILYVDRLPQDPGEG